MAYTAVPTVATGDTWTAANHNTYIRDNFTAVLALIGKFSGCSAIRTASQALTTGTAAAVQLNADDEYDTDDYHNPASNNTRLIAPRDGYYLVTVSALFAANATGYRQINILRSGEIYYIGDAYAPVNTASNASYVTTAVVLYMDAADYVEVFARQNSGGNLNVSEIYVQITLVGV